MTLPEKLWNRIFSIGSEAEFDYIALELYGWHYNNNPVYKKFSDFTGRNPKNTLLISSIPCLPVNVFRHQRILPSGFKAVRHFETSGTTASETGKHYIVDEELYLKSAMQAFDLFYGDIAEYTILALLPGYLERQNSSLVFMVDLWIKSSGHVESGFYLNEHEKLFDVLKILKQKNQKTILLGVTHALVDFAEHYQIVFPELIVMETGGMKGRREELSREELHHLLKPAFGAKSIHSEYGMTELLSQTYSKGNGLFRCPPWMKVLLRDPNDPLSAPENKKSGAINIIDLANMYSCPFIATDDQGVLYEDGAFEINGRLDFSVVRGCNTMIE
jgi:hypothetical protein